MTVATAELFRALAVLSEPPEPGNAVVAEALALTDVPTAADYAETFLLQLYPYASVYLGPEGMLGGEARDRVAGFWRALGLVPPPGPDHLGALLGLYASLIELEEAEEDQARSLLRRSARQALLWEHLLSWVGPYLARFESLGSPVYVSWASLLMESLVAEAGIVGALPTLPLALREGPALPDHHDDATEWVSALLSPVRSGMIMTRSDLGRAARVLGIGLRVGERAFILRALLEQEADGTAAWLAAEADAAAARHRAIHPLLSEVAGFWASRAEDTATALRTSAF